MRTDPGLPIALFDSGVGGLTVFRAVSSLLPNENLLYLGDTARVPYGTKSRETIERYTIMAASTLVERGAKMLVVACNTATSAALPALRKRFAPIPVIGVVEPGAQAAANATKNGRIAVIGTEATIRGQAYQLAISRIMPEAIVEARACTLLVPLAEEGWLDGPVAEEVARKYIGDIFQMDKAPDTLLLGCTHFPLFRDVLQRLVGQDVTIVDSASATAAAVAGELATLDLMRQPDGREASRHFLTTDNIERFSTVGKLFLERDFNASTVELVNL